MASLAVGIFSQPIGATMKCIGEFLRRQCIYICCFGSIISDLESGSERLDNATQELQARVDAATNNVEDITPTVATVLRNSDNYRAGTNRILTEAQNVESSNFNVATRVSLGGKAMARAAEMVQKEQEISNIKNVSLPPRTAASRPIPLGKGVYEFGSRKQIEEDIMTALRADKKNTVGIFGMGGIGKTTMAERIMNRVLEEHVFEEVVMVVVSEQVDVSKIQIEIGRSLGLALENESKQGRLQKLDERLRKTRILLILDDVWTNLNLSKLGILTCDDDGSKVCTILITSRNRDALREMDVKQIFAMEHLSEDDAWFLFTKNAGTCVDEAGLTSIARDVAGKCNGLPIALTIVGAALKGEPMFVWEDTLRELSQPNLNTIPDYINKDVYNLIKVSYDRLKTNQAKLLLICCLFPEDSKISIDQLTYFGWGLGLLDGIKRLEDARKSAWSSIKLLKDRSLLLNSEEGDYVRMHDIVRGFCVFISKQKGLIGGNECSWLFPSGKRIKLSNPKLLLLSLEKLDEIDDNFFERITTLKVLSIKSYSLVSLPQTIQSLKSLRTLRFDSCRKIKTISIVGELENLEILICSFCDSLEELPQEIKRLNCLKLLDLSWSEKLQHIGRGIISSLVELEELKMFGSFNKWEAVDDGRRRNAMLRELESLTNLRCLEIEIADPALAAQNMELSSELERFFIEIPCRPKFGIAKQNRKYYKEYEKESDNKYNKKLILQLKEGTHLGNWIEMLLENVEYLGARGNGANKLKCENMDNIRSVELGECENVNNIAFPHIESLHLYSLSKQVMICDVPISDFTELSSITISDCPLLQNVGQLLIAANDDCLPHLESLEIRNCKMMEQVFLCSQRGSTKLLFPKLKKLDLFLMSKLTTLCQGFEGIEFPLLTEISICECPKMRSIVSTTSSNDQYFSQVSLDGLKKLTTALNLFWRYEFHEPSFDGLEFLNIAGYRGGKSLFTHSLTGNLVSLRELCIENCDEISQVITDERQEGVINTGDGERNRLFPKLEKLELMDLPNLKTFCEWKCDIELPSLMLVEITGCSSMTNFTLGGSLTAPKCLYLNIKKGSRLDVVNDISFGNVKNLNLYDIENPFGLDYTINVSFFNGLEELHINGHSDRKSLFTSSIAERLFNLKELNVDDCSGISKVIEAGEEGENAVVNPPIFPKLEVLYLGWSARLVTFWEWRGDVEWSSLREVTIFECPSMRNITLGTLRTPNLRIVEIDYEEYPFDTTKDLNDMLAPSSKGKGKAPESKALESMQPQLEGEGDKRG